jgi:hypothetical protein
MAARDPAPLGVLGEERCERPLIAVVERLRRRAEPIDHEAGPDRNGIRSSDMVTRSRSRVSHRAHTIWAAATTKSPPQVGI